MNKSVAVIVCVAVVVLGLPLLTKFRPTISPSSDSSSPTPAGAVRSGNTTRPISSPTINEWGQAIMATDVKTIKNWLDSGVDVNTQFPGPGGTALHLAVTLGAIDVATMLINAGANVNATNRDGATPLHSAARKGQALAMPLIISRGANVNAKDNQGHTPLWYAHQFNFPAVAQLLQQYSGTE